MNNLSDEENIKLVVNGEDKPTKLKGQEGEAQSPLVNNTHSLTTDEGEERKSRKRKSPPTMFFKMTDDEKFIEFDKFKRRKDSLRLSASSISAMAGFHPYQNLAKLLMDLVYQGSVGRLLLEHDAKILGMELISDEQALKQIARKAGLTQVIQQAIDIAKGKEKVKHIQDATKVKSNILELVKTNPNLSVGEKKQLSEATRSGVNTGFGNEHEDNALDLYETECGYTVECRNEDLKCWKFQRNNDRIVSSMGPPESWLYQNHQKKEDHNLQKIDALSKNNNESNKPFFFIVGVADGIRDEFYPLTDDDDNNWDLRKVVVECKHRMKRAFAVPPIYDQIQTVLYCMMYGTSEGEIIQVVRNNKNNNSNKPPKEVRTTTTETNGGAVDETSSDETLKEEEEQAATMEATYTKKEAKTLEPKEEVKTTEPQSTKKQGEKKIAKNAGEIIISDKAEAPSSLVVVSKKKEAISKQQPSTSTSITIHRISLDDPVMKHGTNWYETILPRVASFVDAVYSVRRDDDKRYRLIRASAIASSGGDVSAYWEILFHECPWLVDCDTAYTNNNCNK